MRSPFTPHESRIYGSLPEDLGPLALPTDEMLLWLNCPVSVPGSARTWIPDNLYQFSPMLQAIRTYDHDHFVDNYVYITAKTFYVPEGAPPNRPGWHSDGFGTDDVNWIWYDRAPTQFFEGRFTLPSDCEDSMLEMARQASYNQIIEFPNRHLLRLTPEVIHRVNPHCFEGMRTFIKVSLSKDRYDLLGNSLNHDLPEAWPLYPRSPERNHSTYGAPT